MSGKYSYPVADLGGHRAHVRPTGRETKFLINVKSLGAPPDISSGSDTAIQQPDLVALIFQNQRLVPYEKYIQATSFELLRLLCQVGQLFSPDVVVLTLAPYTPQIPPSTFKVLCKCLLRKEFVIH